MGTSYQARETGKGHENQVPGGNLPLLPAHQGEMLHAFQACMVMNEGTLTRGVS